MRPNSPGFTAADLLEARTAALADSFVDTIFYNTNKGGVSIFSHRTEVGEYFTQQHGRSAANLCPALAAAGTDPLAVMVDWCRRENVEIFWSLRMSDTHDGWGTPGDFAKDSHYGISEIKRQHPEWLLGGTGRKPTFGLWSALNYELETVRDFLFRLVEEVCLNYDVAGVECDFMRHPTFFPAAGADDGGRGGGEARQAAPARRPHARLAGRGRRHRPRRRGLDARGAHRPALRERLLPVRPLGRARGRRSLGGAHWRIPGAHRHRTIPALAPGPAGSQILLRLETTDVPIDVGGSLAAAREIELRMRVAKLADAGGVAARWNGRWLEPGRLEEGCLRWRLEPAEVKPEGNLAGLVLTGPSGPVWEDLQVWVAVEGTVAAMERNLTDLES